MKTCKKCNKEFDENLTFCPFCGAENADRKLTYIERKKAREDDTEFMLSKASIQQRDIDAAKEANIDDVKTQKIGELNSEKTKSIVRLLASLSLILCILLPEWLLVKEDINPNLEWAVIVIAFLVVATGASIFISEIYVTRSLNEMEKQDFLVKKVQFNKGPMFVYSGALYELSAKNTCPCCGDDMHIEVMDNVIYIVCSKNREHIYKVDREGFIESFKDKIEQKWD